MKKTINRDMYIAIVILMLVSYALICTEHFTRVNKATVAMFAGVVGWILFMCTGTSFIQQMHAQEFSEFLGGNAFSLSQTKAFIRDHVFFRHMVEVCSIVIYLLATMAIVEVLNNNDCFEFIKDWSRARSSKRVLWMLVLFTFVLSANIDNLTTSVMMLMILKKLVDNPRQRMYIGSAIVIAANCGGCFTVIGDPTSLILWTRGSVTATNFSGALVLPALVATVVPVLLISRKLPETVDLVRSRIMFRGDDCSLPAWQRLIMLIIGIGGLWFIPTFHRITYLPPFLGALCVLGVLWVVNEIVNRRAIMSEQPITISSSRSLQYQVLQTIMFFVGIALCVGVLIEIGAMRQLALWADHYIHNIYLMSVATGLISALMDNISLVLSGISIYSLVPEVEGMTEYARSFTQNGQYWHLIALSGCVGGCLLPIGNTSGYALMKNEDVSFLWYVRHISGKVLFGWLMALVTYFLVDFFLR